jgi:hypothetical protein
MNLSLRRKDGLVTMQLEKVVCRSRLIGHFERGFGIRLGISFAFWDVNKAKHCFKSKLQSETASIVFRNEPRTRRGFQVGGSKQMQGERNYQDVKPSGNTKINFTVMVHHMRSIFNSNVGFWGSMNKELVSRRSSGKILVLLRFREPSFVFNAGSSIEQSRTSRLHSW